MLFEYLYPVGIIYFDFPYMIICYEFPDQKIFNLAPTKPLMRCIGA